MNLTPLAALGLDTVATFFNQYGLIQMKIAHQEHKGFFSLRWLGLGLVFVILAGIGHVVVLPFGDMILFTSTCSVAILFSSILSIWLLKEQFIWKYDLTATILICTGCALTVMQMHMGDVKYDT